MKAALSSSSLLVAALLALLPSCSGFQQPSVTTTTTSFRHKAVFAPVGRARISSREAAKGALTDDEHSGPIEKSNQPKPSALPSSFAAAAAMLAVGLSLSLGSFALPPHPPSAFAAADDAQGGTAVENTKIKKGGASTMQSGRTISITRGVNLDGADFRGQNLKGTSVSGVRDR